MMEQKEMSKNKRFKGIKIIIPILLLALLAGSAFLFGKDFFRKEKKAEIQEPAVSIQETEDWKPTEENLIITEPKNPDRDEAELNAQPEEPETSVAGESEPLTTEGVTVKNVTAFPNENAVFYCYDKDALEYTWEYYSVIDKKWSGINNKPDFISYEEKDSLNRNVSCLSIPGKEDYDGMNIRCTVLLPEDVTTVSEGSMHIFTEEMESISLMETEAEAGEYLSNLDITANIIAGTGENMEISGLQPLLFYVPQNEEERTTYDEESSLTTEIHTKVYKEAAYYFVKEGEQTVPLKFHIGEEVKELELTVLGTDTKAPVMENVRTEYKVSNTDVKSTPVKVFASVSDNYSLPSEIEFAFSKTQSPGKDIQWSDRLPLETEVSENGTYYLLAKDAAGNIGTEKLELITVDMKAPVIEEILVQNESAYMSTNCIEVKAFDKTEMEYCFTLSGQAQQEWQKEPVYTVNTNGEYTVKVRDMAGNTSEGSINVSNIDTTAPVILSITEKGQSDGNHSEFTIEMLPGAAPADIQRNDAGTYEDANADKTKDILSQINGTGTGGITITASGNSGTGINPATAGRASSSTGLQGAKGEKGETGAAGVSSYVHIRYSQDGRGTGMTASPDKGTRYIGIYTGTSKTAPSTASSYSWSLYQGENTHLYMKYAETESGDNMTDEPTGNSKYIGFAVTTEESHPTDPLKYTWSRFREEAERIYMRYSAYANGAEMTETPQEDSKYIGMCTTVQETAPADPAVYEWSRYQGTSSYIHIRYSANGDGSNMTELPAADSSYIGICNSAEETAPSDISAYTWIRLKGNDGNNSFIHVKYSENPDGAGMSDTPNENSCYMGMCITSDNAAPADTQAYQWCRISYGREMTQMRQDMEVMRAQLEAMKSEIEELKNR